MSNEKTAFAVNSRVKPSIFFIEKISFSLKLFSGNFYGNPSLRLSDVLLKINLCNLLNKYKMLLVANALNLSFPTKCSKFNAPISNLHQILPDSG